MAPKWVTALFALVLATGFSFLPAQSSSPATGLEATDQPLVVRGAKGLAAPGAAMDKGTSREGSPLLHLRIVFSRSSEQQTALDKFEAEVLDPSSANYKKWITPQQYGALYGPGDADIATVVAWLKSHGFTVQAVPPGRTHVSFEGTAQQVEQAFQTRLHSYATGGREFYAPVSDPLIPDSLRSAVAGIAGLNTFPLSAGYAAGPALTYSPATGGWETAGAQKGIPGGALPARSPFLAITPADAATIYNSPDPVLNPNANSGPVYTGRGVTIGVVSDAPIRPAAIANYRERFLGDSAVPIITDADGASATEHAEQAYIDAEVAGALAPGASIHIYTAQDLMEAIERALSENSVDILTVGFAACAGAYGAADRRLIQEWWAQAAAQGIAVTAPARSRSRACPKAGDDTNVLANTAYNIAVGGTDTPVLDGGFLPYVNTFSSPARFYASANSYIPESAWSDTSLANDESSWPQIERPASAAPGNFGPQERDGCGAARVGDVCKEPAKPTWQRGSGIATGGGREIPDVSLLAGEGANGSAWAVCTDRSPSEGSDKDCAVAADGRFLLHTFGGDSTAASAFAGILALVQEKSGGRLGQPAAEIYGLYNGPNRSKVFHPTSPGDWLDSSGPDASAGYDRATGLGSVDATELVKYWGSAVGTGAATVSVTPSVNTVSSVAGFTVSVTVAGSGGLGTPTGTVVLQSGSFNSGTQTLAGGSFTFHIAPGALAVGNDTLTVSYSGDSNYGTATGTATVTVTQTTPTVTVTPSTHTLNSNATLNVIVTVVGGGGVAPTGTVTLSGGGYTSPAQALASGTYTFAIPPFSLGAGSDVLSVSYGGDALYAAATGSTTVTVTRSAFSLTATDVTVTAGATTDNASHVTVTPTGSYTGTVALTAAVTASPAGAVSAPTLTGSSVTITSGPATGFITVATTAAPAAKRGPLARANGWFEAAGTTVIAGFLFWLLPGRTRRWRAAMSALLFFIAASFVAAGCGGGSKKTPTVTVKPSQSSIKVGDSLSVAITVAGTGSAAPTGTVSLTSGSFSVSGSLSGGSATLMIPANTLTAGQSNTLTANYSGDNHYLSASGSATVTVAAPGTTPGVYTVTVTGTGNDAGNTTATATFTLTVR